MVVPLYAVMNIKAEVADTSSFSIDDITLRDYSQKADVVIALFFGSLQGEGVFTQGSIEWFALIGD